MKNRKTLNILCILTSVLVVLAALFELSKMSQAGLFRSASAFFSIVATILGAYYIISGFAKSDALEYKLFLAFYGLAELALIGASSKTMMPEIAAVARALVYSGIIILAMVKDLGKKASLFIARAIVLFEELTFVYSLIMCPGVLRNGELINTLMIISTSAMSFLSCLTLGFVTAKYKDKEARGSK